jgi:hypothetical protein
VNIPQTQNCYGNENFSENQKFYKGKRFNTQLYQSNNVLYNPNSRTLPNSSQGHLKFVQQHQNQMHAQPSAINNQNMGNKNFNSKFSPTNLNQTPFQTKSNSIVNNVPNDDNIVNNNEFSQNSAKPISNTQRFNNNSSNFQNNFNPNGYGKYPPFSQGPSQFVNMYSHPQFGRENVMNKANIYYQQPSQTLNNIPCNFNNFSQPYQINNFQENKITPLTNYTSCYSKNSRVKPTPQIVNQTQIINNINIINNQNINLKNPSIQPQISSQIDDTKNKSSKSLNNLETVESQKLTCESANINDDATSHIPKEKTELFLKISIQLKDNKEKSIEIWEGADLVKVVKDFCKENQLSDEIAIPIISKINISLDLLEDFNTVNVDSQVEKILKEGYKIIKNKKKLMEFVEEESMKNRDSFEKSSDNGINRGKSV